MWTWLMFTSYTVPSGEGHFLPVNKMDCLVCSQHQRQWPRRQSSDENTALEMKAPSEKLGPCFFFLTFQFSLNLRTVKNLIWKLIICLCCLSKVSSFSFPDFFPPLTRPTPSKCRAADTVAAWCLAEVQGEYWPVVGRECPARTCPGHCFPLASGPLGKASSLHGVMVSVFFFFLFFLRTNNLRSAIFTIQKRRKKYLCRSEK